MTDIRALLFDFDGVLANTEPYHWQAWRLVLQGSGIDLTWDVYEQMCIGVSDVEMLDGLRSLAPAPVTLQELKALYPMKRKAFNEIVASLSLVDSSMRDTLKALHDYRLGVVTSSNQTEIEPILLREGILPLFAAAVYGNDVRLYKPHPDPYLLACERLGVDPGRTVVFEDSMAGLASGRSAGCKVVAVGCPVEVAELVGRVVSGAYQF